MLIHYRVYFETEADTIFLSCEVSSAVTAHSTYFTNSDFLDFLIGLYAAKGEKPTE